MQSQYVAQKFKVNVCLFMMGFVNVMSDCRESHGWVGERGCTSLPLPEHSGH